MKSVKLEIRCSWSPEQKSIKVVYPGWPFSTVSDDPKSKRYHPHLYRKLAQTLRRKGSPGPEVNPTPGMQAAWVKDPSLEEG